MPIFEFFCKNCQKEFESLMKPYDPIECKFCHGKYVKKLVSKTAHYDVTQAEVHHKGEAKGIRVRDLVAKELKD